jgi:hypothetical protein
VSTSTHKVAIVHRPPPRIDRDRGKAAEAIRRNLPSLRVELKSRAAFCGRPPGFTPTLRDRVRSGATAGGGAPPGRLDPSLGARATCPVASLTSWA